MISIKHQIKCYIVEELQKSSESAEDAVSASAHFAHPDATRYSQLRCGLRPEQSSADASKRHLIVYTKIYIKHLIKMYNNIYQNLLKIDEG